MPRRSTCNHRGLPLPDDRCQARDKIRAMRKQERKAYTCKDYLKKYQGEEIIIEKRRHSPKSVSSPKSSSEGSLSHRCPSIFTSNDRKNIVQYSYRVADFCSIPREVVSISMNYFDRFMETESCRAWLDAVGLEHLRRQQ